MSEKVPFGGLTVVEGETKVYRDNQGRLRISHMSITEPKTSDGLDIPDGKGTIGTVQEVNDDGTVTISVE